MAVAVSSYDSIDKVVSAGHCTSAFLVFSEKDLEDIYVLGDVVKCSGLAIYIFRGVIADRQITTAGLKITVITEV